MRIAWAVNYSITYGQMNKNRIHRKDHQKDCEVVQSNNNY